MKIKTDKTTMSVVLTFKGQRDWPHVILVKSRNSKVVDKLIDEYIKTKIDERLHPVHIKVWQHHTYALSQ